ncbi:MAG: TIGR04282 family arsenosugar biosynthesis glycosyltransferase [Planctomycetales bacterium]
MAPGALDVPPSCGPTGSRGTIVHSVHARKIPNRKRAASPFSLPNRKRAASPFSPAERAGDDYELWPQPQADLGARLQSFFRDHCDGRAGGGAVAIGTDSPTLPRDFVERAFDLLERHDCVLGPATDGGYCLAGLRDSRLPIFEGIAWSGPRVLEQTIARLERCGASLALLPPWYDVDAPADLAFLRGHIRAMLRAGQTVDCPHTLPLLGIE